MHMAPVHQAQLVLGWLTISVCNQPPRSTQFGHPSVAGAMSTSESCDLNRHTTQCTSLVSVVSQCKKWCLAEGLRKRRSVLPYGP